MKKTNTANLKPKTNDLNIPKEFVSTKKILNSQYDELQVLAIPDYVNEWINLPKLKKLKITKQEAIFNYSNLVQYNAQLKHICQKDNKCLYGGFHIGFNRDDNGKLRVYTYDCPFKKNYESISNYQTKFLFKNNIILNHVDDIENIYEELNDLNELQTREFSNTINCFYKFFKVIKTKNQLQLGFWYSGPNDIGKTYSILSLCNSLAKLNYSIIYIDNFEMSSKFSNFEENDTWQLLDLFKNVDVLIIDNFGLEFTKNNWFYGNALPMILESRNVENKLTGFLSNYSRNELLEIFKKNTRLDIVNINRLFTRINNLVQKNVKEIKNKDKLC